MKSRNDRFTNKILLSVFIAFLGSALLSAQTLRSPTVVKPVKPANVAATLAVTYNGNGNTGGSAPTDRTAYSTGKTVTVLGNTGGLVRTGYKFLCWNSTSNGSGKDAAPGSTFAMASSNVVLFAKWSADFTKAVSYTVSFDGQGATTQAKPPTKIVTSPATTIDALPTAPAKAGNSFGGWYTSNNFSGTEFTAKSPVTANITLYAKWIPSYSHIVSFDSQGATAPANPARASVTSPATTVTSFPAPPTRNGYSFGGWYTAANGGGTEFTRHTTVSAPITVYAKWSAVYSVTFDSQAANIPAKPASKNVTSPAINVGALPTPPSKIGYTFGGWYTASGGGGTAFSASTPVAANITVFAKWTANTYTVTFDGQSPTTPANPASKTVLVPATTVGALPNPPQKTGYIFGGWYSAPNGGGTAFAANTSVAANNTVFAKWNPNVYTVTFNSPSATTPANPASKTVTIPATTVGTLPSPPKKTGFVFKGWFPNPDGMGTEFTASTPVSGNRSVIAYWITLPKITFDGQGATTQADPSSKQVVEPGMTVGVLPTAPSRANYVFSGWYTAANGGGTEFTASSKVMTDTTVYAKWKAAEYTITFDSQGATTPANPSSKIVVYPNTRIGTLPSPPMKTGYSFRNWTMTINGQVWIVSEGMAVTGNTTIYAQWDPDYTMSYNGNGNTGGTAPPSVTFHRYVTSAIPVSRNTGNLVKTGYVFNGWSKNSPESMPPYHSHIDEGSQLTTTMYDKDIILYADWNPTVTLYRNDGTEPNLIAVKTYPMKSRFDEGDYLVRPGYIHSGWYENPAGTGARYYVAADRFIYVTAPLVLYAHWYRVLTLSYAGNGNTAGNVPAPQIVGTFVVVNDIGGLAKAGNSFIGWNTKSNGSGTTFHPGDLYYPDPAFTDVTLSAMWTSSTVYTVTYKAGDASNISGSPPVDPNKYAHGQIYKVLGSGTLTRPGMRISMWATKQYGTSGSDQRYIDHSFAMGSENVVLYPIWDAK